MTQFIESWFIPVWFLALAIILLGGVLLIRYREPGIRLSELITGTKGGQPYPLGMKPRFDMVRASKRKLVYGVYFVGAALAMIDVLLFAGFAIARSLG